jgi:hypothetical protein
MLAGRRNNRAFGLPDLLALLVVIGLGLLFVAGAYPRRAQSVVRISCVNNLKQIGLSFRIWAGDNKDRFPMQVSTNEDGTMELGATNVFAHFRAMSNELNTPKVILCPEDKKHTPATNFLADLNNSRVSYFIGLDANETNATMLLAGDRNLVISKALPSNPLLLLSNQPVSWTREIHKDCGNIALADASVQQLTTSALRAYLIGSGIATNSLAFP